MGKVRREPGQEPRGIYRFHKVLGHGAELNGIFVATTAEVKALSGETIYFGNVGGDRPPARLTVYTSDFRKVSGDPKFVRLFEKHNLEKGVNPVTTHAFNQKFAVILESGTEADG